MSLRQTCLLDIDVLPQPDDITCGPTCLQAVYGYWGHHVGLDEAISSIEPLPDGGTIAASLACDALRKGFAATIYTYNLLTFDPTWFPDTSNLGEQLEKQKQAKNDPKLNLATDTYREFLRLGGTVQYQQLNAELLRGLLDDGKPILTGLSATYLYECARELNDEYDDVRGEPSGHFVVLCGYDRSKDLIMVADPHEHDHYQSRFYPVKTDRVIASILLGIVTYDANLLIITPKVANSE